MILCLWLLLANQVVGAQPSSISINISANTVTLGDPIIVWGHIDPPVIGAIVSISYIRPDGPTVNKQVTTSLLSTYEVAYVPDRAGSWSVIASWTGNQRYEGATSSTRSFTVVGLPIGTSRITCIADALSTVQGTSVRIQGAVTPGLSTSVVIEFSIDGTLWSILTTVISSSNGNYSYIWIPERTGTYFVRASWLGSAETKGATSSVLHIMVHPAYEADFSISADPSVRTVDPGKTTTFTVTLVSLYGFDREVSLSVINLPTGTTSSFNPASVSKNSSSVLTVSTSPSTPAGTHILTITGGALDRTRAANVSLSVTASVISPRCMIATAVFGTSLAPEVQLLRAFRDDLVMSSFAGKEFMKVFNLWYYSFSPLVATFIADRPIARQATQIALGPIIEILGFSSTIRLFPPFNSESQVVAVGLIASALIGLVYVLPSLTILHVMYRYRPEEDT